MPRLERWRTGWVGQYTDVSVPHGFTMSWFTAAGSPAKGFGLGVVEDADDDLYTVVVPNEREEPDGAITPVWVTYQPGGPRGSGIVHETLREAVSAAAEHLRPGFTEDTPAFDEVLATILAQEGVDRR